MLRSLLRCAVSVLGRAASVAQLLAPLITLWRALMSQKQSLTLLSSGDPRAAPLLTWDKSQRTQWVVVISLNLAGPYTVLGDYRSLRKARYAAARVSTGVFAYVCQVNLGAIYLYSGPLHGR